MSELTNHYLMLLGLDAAWRVEQVQFSISDKQVEIHLTHRGGQLTCSECGKPSKGTDAEAALGGLVKLLSAADH